MKPVKTTVPEVLPLAQAIFDRDAAGCCLHVVLDDENLEDRNVQGCIDLAVERDHDDCERLARLLIGMTRSQRGRIAKRAK